MIYNTTCGDLDVALTAAQVLVHYRRKKSGPSELAHSLRCAAHVAQRAGALDTALAYLLDAVTIAEENRLVTHAIRLSGMLAEHYFEALNLSEARAWYTRAVHWTQGAEDPVLHAQNVVFAAKLALAEGKLGEAREHLENTALGVLCAGTFAGQIDVLATRVHLFIAQGEKIPATLLSDFDGTFACLWHSAIWTTRHSYATCSSPPKIPIVRTIV